MVGANNGPSLRNVFPANGFYRMKEIEKGPDDRIQKMIIPIHAHIRSSP